MKVYTVRHIRSEHEINIDEIERLPKERIKVPRKKRPDLARAENLGNIELAKVTDPSVTLSDEESSKVYSKFAGKGLDGNGGNDVTIKTVDWGDFDVEQIVELLVLLGEKLSDKALFSYQKVHVRRIFRSVLKCEGARLSTLFSRQCVAEGQQIAMADGTTKEIQDVKIGDKILSYNTETGIVEEDVIVDAWETGEKECFSVRSDHGYEAVTSADHKFLTQNGWKKVSEIETGKDLLFTPWAHLTGSEVFQSVAYRIGLVGTKKTYDLTTKKNHNFICEGFVVHNSGKSETTAIAVVTLCVAIPALAEKFPDQLGTFKHGFRVGVFGPNSTQAKNIFERITSTAKSDSAKLVYEDPDIGTEIEKYGCKWSNGSFVKMQTADPKASIEGLSLDLIVLDECVAEDTLVSSPLGETVIRDLQVGDPVLSYSEETRKVETSFVEAVIDKGSREVFRVEFDDGTFVEGTGNHPLYVENEGWVEISLLNDGDIILALSPTKEIGKKRVVSKTSAGKRKVYDITVSENHNFFANGTLAHNCQDMEEWVINKSILPMGAWNNSTVVTIGTTNDKAGYFYNLIQTNRMADMNRALEDRRHAEFDYQTVIKYNPRYAAFVEQEKAENGPQSRHFLMNFCLRWLFEEGSAVSDSALKEYAMKRFTGFTPFTIKEPVVVGIDVGSEINSTVVTVGKIVKGAEIEYDDVVEKKSVVQICDWYELEDLDYPTQRALIKAYLERYKNIVWITVDETGVGKSALQEMKKEWRGFRTIEGFIFAPKSKAYLRSLFEEYLYSFRIIVPSTPEARASEKWQKWYLQMVNLQKVTKAGHVVFEKKQTISSARDDFPDSFFLMLHAASQAMRNNAVAEITSFEDLVVPKQKGVFEEIREKARKGEIGTKNNLRASRMRKLLKGVI